MTIKQARKILGAMADKISDEELQIDIDTVAMLEELFFNQLNDNQKKSIQNQSNVP